MKKSGMKKLVLHKQTVRVLTDRDLRDVAGGLSSPYTCNYTQSCGCSRAGCATLECTTGGFTNPCTGQAYC
jgi:hypothetical protein